MGLAEEIAEYVMRLKDEALPDDVVRLVKERVVDSIGVALGAYNAPPVVISRELLKKFGGYGSNGIGVDQLTPDHAAFLNGCMVRYIDFNDTYLSKEALHPSDNIPAILSAGEYVGADGVQLIKGITASYEVACRLADAVSIRDRGWDHVTYIAISSAVGASLVLDLPYNKIVQAINIATTPNIALRQTRVGELSMWKGCAAANAARNGLFAALLASGDMTGPSPIFEGERGFFKQVTGEFKLDFPKDEFKIRETSIKKYPVEYHSMSAVEAALNVRKNIPSPEDVKEVKIETFSVSYQIIVKDPEKWEPKTKETADHSLPYIVATTLLDGYIWVDSYSDDKLVRPTIKKILGNMVVSMGKGFDDYYPEGIPNKVIVSTRDGVEYEDLVIYPKGHFKNPMDVNELYEKYERLVQERLGNYKEVWDTVWRLESLSNVNEIIETINKGLLK